MISLLNQDSPYNLYRNNNFWITMYYIRVNNRVSLVFDLPLSSPGINQIIEDGLDDLFRYSSSRVSVDIASVDINTLKRYYEKDLEKLTQIRNQNSV